MLVGFGYLNSAMAKTGLSAIGFAFFLTMLAVQADVLFEHFFYNALSGETTPVSFDIVTIVRGDLAAATCLISFGALVGKCGMNKLIIVMLFEVVFYTLNKELIFGHLHAKDLAGTLQIHLFGAYFGLGAAAVLGMQKHPAGADHPKGHPDAVASRNSDVLVLLGTVFLWVFWPVLNAYGAPRGTDSLLMGSPTQLRMIVNTILALTSSTTWAFVMSKLFNSHKFGPVDIQNATLAGGVMVGICSSLPLHPAGALGIGMIAATVSTFGFNVLDPLLMKGLVHDTLGIHSRHGLPALCGGIYSVIYLAFFLPPSPGGDIAHAFGPGADAWAAAYPEGVNQWKANLYATFATLAISFFGGVFTMGFVKAITICNDKRQGAFDDENYWAVKYDI